MKQWMALAGLVALASGCGGEGGEPARAEPDSATPDSSAAAAGAPAPDAPDPGAPVAGGGAGAGPARHAAGGLVSVQAVQLGSFADSSAAAVLRDSLERAGWAAYVRPAVARGGRVWRVQVAPGSGAELPRLTAFALRRSGREALVVADSAPAEAVAGVRVVPVNRGTHGMAATTRWVLSPDRRALLAVEDPAAVEAEAVPNGFVFATEAGPLLMQQDSVWDVAPSPDWRRLAFGRAEGEYAREGGELTASQWAAMARRIGLPETVVRERAFPISGMNVAYGVARPVLVDVSGRDAAPPATPRGSAQSPAVLAGWRVRWAEGGALLGAGLPPARVQDDAPASGFILLDTLGRTRPSAEVGTARWAAVRWVEGPTIDISVPVDVDARRTVEIEGGVVESRGGWIRVVQAGARGGIVGPGVALAATRAGRYIAALAPNPEAKEYEAKTGFVVYEVTP